MTDPGGVEERMHLRFDRKKVMMEICRRWALHELRRRLAQEVDKFLPNVSTSVQQSKVMKNIQKTNTFVGIAALMERLLIRQYLNGVSPYHDEYGVVCSSRDCIR